MSYGSAERLWSRVGGFLAVVAIAAAAAGCDTAPGPELPGLRPPVVSGFTYAPATVVVDDLPPDAVTDDAVRVTVSAQVQVLDPDSDVDRVGFVVMDPAGASTPVATGVLSGLGQGRYGMETEVAFPRGLVGRYTLLVYAVDRSGRLGNEVRGAIDLLATGTPPVITGVEMPETVRRPAPGEPPTPVTIVATVTDPDGLANVLRVETLVNAATTPLYLCDDGGQGACNAGFGTSGDAVAGDGRFTLTVAVESGNAPGPNTFVFTAVDRSGLRSEPVTRTIVIEP